MLEGLAPTSDLLRAQETWRPGLSVFAVHAALRGNLGSGGRTFASAAAGLGTTDGIARHPDDILVIRAESPLDVAAHNPQNLGGSCHGGEFVLDGAVVPGWPRYDTDVPGLFLTSATVHPGGSVSGRPGRNAARTVLASLGLDPPDVMGQR